jgi:hypothetical protein
MQPNTQNYVFSFNFLCELKLRTKADVFTAERWDGYNITVRRTRIGVFFPTTRKKTVQTEQEKKSVFY